MQNTPLLEDYESTIPRSEALMRQAHPVRCPVADPMLVDGIERIVGPRTWAALKGGFETSDMTSNVVVRLVQDPQHHRLRELLQASSGMPGGAETGHFYGNLVGLRYAVNPAPYFRIDDDLCQLLINTDLADDVPVDVMKAPFPRFYMEFGTERNLPLFVPNEMTGLHAAEGVYVEYGVRSDSGPGFYLVFTGSPLGKAHALDDATQNIFLRIADGATLKEAIEQAYRMGAQYAKDLGFKAAGEETMAPALALLNFLAKALLYINLPEARRSIHAERSEYFKSVSGLKSPAKKNKALRRGRTLVDYILVSAPPLSTEDSADGAESGRGVKTHWRRGHYRMQAYGPEHGLRRLAFIRPTLVRADLGLGAGSSTYRVA